MATKPGSIPGRGTKHPQQVRALNPIPKGRIMSKTFKTDPWDVKEARGVARHPREFRREHSLHTRHTRDLSKRIRARERREMERITRDLEAWESYYPTGATLREFETSTNKAGWQY